MLFFSGQCFLPRTYLAIDVYLFSHWRFSKIVANRLLFVCQSSLGYNIFSPSPLIYSSRLVTVTRSIAILKGWYRKENIEKWNEIKYRINIIRSVDINLKIFASILDMRILFSKYELCNMYTIVYSRNAYTLAYQF